MRWIQKPPLGAQINWAHPLAKGLVGYWLFNEGGGDKAADLGRYGYDGTLVNVAFPPTSTSGWGTGRDGPTIVFNGTNAYVNIGQPSYTASPTQISVSLWLNTNTLTGGSENLRYAISREWIDKGWMIRLSTADDKIYWYHRAGGAWPNVATSNAIVADTWYHIVTTLDTVTGTIKIYVNGQLDNTAGGGSTITTAAVDVLIGSSALQTSRAWSGMLSDVRIYNRVLTAQEIVQLYVGPYAMFEWPLVWQWSTAVVAADVNTYFMHYQRLRRAV